MLKHRPAVCAAAVIASLALAGTASAAPQVDTSAWREAVTEDGITPLGFAP